VKQGLNNIPAVRLRLLLFISLTLGTFILIAVLVLSYNSSMKKQELATLVQLGEAVSGSAASMIVDFIIEEDYAGLDEICLGYVSNPSVITARITDTCGKVLADSSAQVLGTILPGFPMEMPKDGEASFLSVQEFKGSLITARAISFEEKIFGYVLLEISKERMIVHLHQGQRRFFLIGAFFGCIGLFLSWFVALWFIRPLEQMTAMAEALSRGEQPAEIRSSYILELEQLAGAFKRMGEKISRRENALLASEKQYRDIFENALEGIFQTTAEGHFTNVNPRMAILLGYSSPEELITAIDGLGDQLLVSTKDGQRLFTLLKEQGEVVQHEVRLIGKGHQIIWGSLNIRTIYDTDGTIIGFEGLLEDVTGQKKSAEVLAEERERLAVTLRSIGDGVISTDREGLITLLNRAAEEMTGWSLEEALGRSLAEVFCLFNGLTGELCENPVEKVIACGQIVELASHTVLVSRDGIRRNIADSGAPIRDENSEVIGVVLVFRDVTEFYNVEQERLKLKKLESLGTLAGGIAHDFNNILASILGNINMALHKGKLDDKTTQYLERAEKASLRAKGLTAQLLTFAKGGAPVKEAASIDEMVRESAAFVLHGSNVSCSCRIPDDLWLVDIDKGQISQVIQNLVINADHAMLQGGDITISCENCPVDTIHEEFVKTAERYVRISVSDTGVGIPANALEKIFDPYFSTKQQGSGLGLSICHSILAKHGGNISVQSVPGMGTTFALYLPAAKSQQPKVRSQQEEEVVTPERKIRVLIMDDEEMVRDIARDMLIMLGHEVEAACDGEEAIAIFTRSLEEGNPVDVVIMDLTIPGGMGGKEAVRKILAIAPDARVIVSSGYSSDPVMANYQQYGFTAAIGKPYQLQDLAAGIEMCLQSGRS